MAILPALAQPTMRKITGNDQVALGHFGTISYWAAGEVGNYSKGNLNLQKILNFLKG